MRKRLTNKKINKLCDEIIKDINLAKENQYPIFLCSEFSMKLNCEHIDIKSLIPMFTRENATKYADAIGGFNYWWAYSFFGDRVKNESAYSNRIKFLEWLKSQYPVTPKV